MVSTDAGGDPIPEEPTIALVEQLRARDPQGPARLNELYRAALLRFCWGYLGTMDEAEDAVQEILCKVVAAPNVPEAFRPWLYRIARNHCLNVRRHRASRKDNRELPDGSQIYQAMTGQLTRLARDEEQARLIELVQALPEILREALRLRYVEGLSRGEIAEVLEIPEAVVKSRLFEGLRKLRERAARLMDS